MYLSINLVLEELQCLLLTYVESNLEFLLCKTQESHIPLMFRIKSGHFSRSI